MPATATPHLIDVDALRIGMFIHLDLGWMAHPFPLSSFKISSAEQIETVENRTVVQYRGALMPVTSVDGGPVTPWTGEVRPMLVFAGERDAVGVIVDEIIDIIEADLSAPSALSGGRVSGSLIVAGRATELINVDAYWPTAGDASRAVGSAEPSRSRRLLVVDGSPFCRLMLQPLLAQAGYEVVVVDTPEAALALHEAGEEFGLIMAETSDEAERARRFAAAFGRAGRWSRTPVLGLSMLQAATGAKSPRLEQVNLLQAVTSALAVLEPAA